MTGGPNIRAISQEAAQDAQSEPTSEEVETLLPEDEFVEDEWDFDEQPGRRFTWVWPGLAILTIAGWTAFYGWANHTDILAGGTLQQWTGWITAWAVPVLLVVSAWLLISRNSSREAERFGVIAHNLSTETALLEERLTTVNRELSLARDFLGSQSRELDSLGRIATERLSEHAERLQSLISTNGEQIDSIANVSTTALENMGKLRDDLPVVANSAKDVSNQIGTAGMTAHNQIAELIAGFQRLNQFGQASEKQVDSFQSKIEVALTSLGSQASDMEELADTRFALLREKSDEFRADLDSREVDALAAIRRRAETIQQEFSGVSEELRNEENVAFEALNARAAAIREEAAQFSDTLQDNENTALNLWNERVEKLRTQLVSAITAIQKIDEQALNSANVKLEALRVEAEAVDASIAERDAKLMDSLAARKQAFAESEDLAISALGESFAGLDAEIATRREAQLAETELLAERSEAIVARIEALQTILGEVSQLGGDVQSNLADNLTAVTASLAEAREGIAITDGEVGELTEACVRLLELIQASAQHSTVDLPAALGTAEERLVTVKQEATELDSIIGQATEKSEAMSAYVLQTHENEREAIADVDALRERIAASHEESREMVLNLKNDLSGLNEESELLSAKAQNELRAAISSLEDAAKNAPQLIETEIAASVETLASGLAAKTGKALEITLRTSTETAIAELDEAASQANQNARETTIQLRDQLSKVNELAGNLETRVSRAREQAEEQVNNDFSRRMALLTDSLNSNSIDIAKALSSDVTDTAWASYLKGDRGIFTRRAVRLLDNTEARDIAEIYDEDPGFRENVSRYIHDFESMLRSMLSTRDGNALGVTILSSDMGKLYVALAQAIERLRDD